MIRYWVALARFQAVTWWVILTGRGHLPAPGYVERAYNAQADAWRQSAWLMRDRRMSLREQVRTWLARHESLFTFLWYLHLVRNEPPADR